MLKPLLLLTISSLRDEITQYLNTVVSHTLDDFSTMISSVISIVIGIIVTEPRSSIRIVDEIVVSNQPDNGIIHWDMLTRENLEIAAGMYIYHIDAKQIGEEKVGKFAVIK